MDDFKRTKEIIMHLIALEVRRRQTYYNLKKEMPPDFSTVTINQMHKILEKKHLTKEENLAIKIEIETFKLTTEK